MRIWPRSGSSPLTRGKRKRVPGCRLVCGLIPAHAGKTLVRRCGGLGPRAHPRSRGENGPRRDHRDHQRGSSPLTRGKRQQAGRTVDVLGLIPAHAGKTIDHKRVSFNAAGSSPLTRGKLFGADRALGGRGLIPAHAGKTRRIRYRMSSRGAHPRSRGENVRPLALTVPIVGSSPLTRGKLADSHVDMSSPRLIPAHAGKTARRRRHGARSRAHPRSRGENLRAKDRATKAKGSSPLTRGKLDRKAPLAA